MSDKPVDIPTTFPWTPDNNVSNVGDLHRTPLPSPDYEFPSTPNDVANAGDSHWTAAPSSDYEFPERCDGVAAGPTESMEQNVNHPTRYTKGKVECIDALESAVVGKPPDEAIYVANIIKYLWRYEEKEPLRSLKSAKWYLDRLIGKIEVKYGPKAPVVTREEAIGGKANRESPR